MILANDQASKGVWVHASTNTDLTWINPMRTCRGDGLWVSSGGEVMIMRIGSEKNFNGAWCDTHSTDAYNSICKAPISNK